MIEFEIVLNAFVVGRQTIKFCDSLLTSRRISESYIIPREVPRVIVLLLVDFDVAVKPIFNPIIPIFAIRRPKTNISPK